VFEFGRFKFNKKYTGMIGKGREKWTEKERNCAWERQFQRDVILGRGSNFSKQKKNSRKKVIYFKENKYFYWNS